MGSTLPAYPPGAPIRWREQYDGSEDLYTIASGTVCSDDEDRTVQAGAEDADINVMLRRFHITGEMPEAPPAAPYYGDFSQIGTYQEALAAIEDARESFNALPADVRRRFENDPGELIAFVQDERNRAEAVALGLLQPAPIPEPPPRKMEPQTGS